MRNSWILLKEENLYGLLTKLIRYKLWIWQNFLSSFVQDYVLREWARVSHDLLPSQCLEELVVSKGSEGEIWQDGQQVSQQVTVGRHEVGRYHDNWIHCRGRILLGVRGGNAVAGVCVTLACKTHQ